MKKMNRRKYWSRAYAVCWLYWVLLLVLKPQWNMELLLWISG